MSFTKTRQYFPHRKHSTQLPLRRLASLATSHNDSPLFVTELFYVCKESTQSSQVKLILSNCGGSTKLNQPARYTET